MKDQNKFNELVDEFREIVLSRNNILDAILPPLVFLVVNGLFGINQAILSSVIFSVLISIGRLVRRQPLSYAIGGLVGVLFAFLIVQLLGRAEGFFLPGILSGTLTVITALVSLLIKKPFVAWTSHFARRWPWEWYWHSQVRPAYTEVTWVWLVFFLLRLLVQINYFQAQQTSALALVNLFFGWPAIIILLIFSYLYGTWRIRNLQGPSVEEFLNNKQPPWEGQKKGF